MIEIENEIQFDFSPFPRQSEDLRVWHTTRYWKGSFSSYLAKLIAAEVHMQSVRAPLELIEKYTINAEEQYHALMFFYKLLYKQGICEKPPTTHNYQLLSNTEKRRIRQLKLANVPLLYIANELNRPVSTIHYFCKRENLL